MANNYEEAINNIIKWADEWAKEHSSYTNDDLKEFAKDLNKQVLNLEFNDSEDKSALGYGGKVGENNTGNKTEVQISAVLG